MLWIIVASVLFAVALAAVATRRWPARRKTAVAAALAFIAFLPIGCVYGFSYPGDDQTSCVILAGIELPGVAGVIAPFLAALATGVLFRRFAQDR